MGIRPKTIPKSKGSIMAFLLNETNYDYPMLLEKVHLVLEAQQNS